MARLKAVPCADNGHVTQPEVSKPHAAPPPAVGVPPRRWPASLCQAAGVRPRLLLCETHAAAAPRLSPARRATAAAAALARCCSRTRRFSPASPPRERGRAAPRRALSRCSAALLRSLSAAGVPRRRRPARSLRCSPPLRPRAPWSSSIPLPMARRRGACVRPRLLAQPARMPPTTVPRMPASHADAARAFPPRLPPQRAARRSAASAAGAPRARDGGRSAAAARRAAAARAAGAARAGGAGRARHLVADRAERADWAQARGAVCDTGRARRGGNQQFAGSCYACGVWGHARMNCPQQRGDGGGGGGAFAPFAPPPR